MTPTDKIRIAEFILRANTDYRVALKQIGEAFGEQTSRHALHALFRRAGKGAPSDLLKLPPIAIGACVTYDPVGDSAGHVSVVPPKKEPKPEPDPVQRREAQEEQSRDKREIAKLVDQLREARARQGFLDRLESFRAPPHILAREKTSGVREMTGVVLASDWHVEEPVEAEAVAYRNEYNLEIAAARIQRFFAGIIWKISHDRASGLIAIRDLVLWLGGDLMTGYIHPELVESNLLSPTETIRWLLPFLRNGIHSLLLELRLESLTVPCSYGNHGRTTDKRRIATGYANSFEWLMYHSLADEFRSEPRIRFEITNSPHQYVQVYDKLLHFHHGDDVRYQGGVGGLGIPLLKAVPLWERVRSADVHNIGHHHTLIDYGRAVVNGSLIGYGPYSQAIRAPFEPPQQAMYYIDSKRGKCMPSAIWVDSEEDRARYAAAAHGIAA